MLIDEVMPAWDARERHRITVRAAAEEVYEGLRTADLGGHPVARVMLALRALPAALTNRSGFRRLREEAARPLTLSAFERRGFRVLADDPPRELLIGLEGAFWTPNGDLRPVDAASFAGPIPAGVARAAWNFTISPAGSGRCVLRTETRVLAGDAAARRRFRLYWLIVRPGSGLLRRIMLRAIRRRAEALAAERGAADAAPPPVRDSAARPRVPR